MDAHANTDLRISFQRFGNFFGAKNRCLRAVAESKRAAVTGRQSQQFSFRFSSAELLSSANDLAQFLDLGALLVNAQLGIADDVNEKDMGYLQSELRFLLVAHRGMNLGGFGEALYLIFTTERSLSSYRFVAATLGRQPAFDTLM